MLAEYRRRRDFVIERLRQIPGRQYRRAERRVLCVSGYQLRASRRTVCGRPMQFAEQLLAKAHVAVVPGEAFGTDKHVRISYAASMEDLQRGLDRHSQVHCRGMSVRLIEPKFVERVWGTTELAAAVPRSGQRKSARSGSMRAPEFPLLIKFIFTSEKLSVQVHPDDEYARAVENCRGKTEMWHILSAKPGSTLALGFRERRRRINFGLPSRTRRSSIF